MKQKLKNLWNYFTTYEKIWFISITVLAFAFAIIFPEEDFGGVNGKVIMALYLLDIFLNITCELLISKQSKWNFIVSLGVEITEILICVVLSYRFATMATTLFFWIPIDIISFINWNRHKDREQEELTEVRRLTGKQEVLVLTGIVLWTVVVGYFLTTLEIEGLLSSTPPTATSSGRSTSRPTPNSLRHWNRTGPITLFKFFPIYTRTRATYACVCAYNIGSHGCAWAVCA